MKQFKRPRGFNKLLRKAFYGRYANWPKTIWFRLFIARSAYRKVKKKAHNPANLPLRVIFFVVNISMWKFENLFKRFLDDKRFEPIIIPYPLLWHTDEENSAFERDIVSYCKRMGFPYKIGYNIDTMEYIPARELKADFVCYTQNYNNCPDFWKLEKFYHSALIFTYPYGEPVDNSNELMNTLCQNVSWKLFWPVKSSVETFRRNLITRGKNFTYVGSDTFEKFKGNESVDSSCWKVNCQSLKRVIWAPHHTIGNNDAIPFSSFLSMYDGMLELADEYKDRVQFVFKPHPILYHRLLDLWGKEKTDEYYQKWAKGENTGLAEGDYTTLFMSSDAMIHDSVGFSAEYLYTGKPVMHTGKSGMEKHLSEFGAECLKLHYRGNTIPEIKQFIESTVLGGNDPLKQSRELFYKESLQPPNNKTASENMFEYFVGLTR